MNKRLLVLGLVAPFALVATAAMAQPSSKLTGGLDKPTIAKLWCSALLYEESFWYDSGSEWSYYYEDLAYLLEDDIHDTLLGAGLGEPEIAEIWQVFDDAAMDLAETDEAAYNAQIDPCKAQYRTLLPQPKD